jgi:pimeloyl-ACP methyl ester carboxylesterase
MTELHVETLGAGVPVIALHSGGMSGRQWRKLGEVLAPDHEVLLPDLLGSGKNPPWPDAEPFEVELDVNAVRAVLARAGRAHLVGHSYGGLLALTLAREAPGSVLSLSLYDPVAFGVLYEPPDEVGLANLRSARENPVFTDDTRGGNREWLETFVDYWNGKGSWNALPPPARAAFEKVGRKVFYEVRSLAEDRTPASAYAAIAAPTLFLTGEHTPAAARGVIARLMSVLPGAQRIEIAGAGHMGPITHAPEVNAAIARNIAAA